MMDSNMIRKRGKPGKMLRNNGNIGYRHTLLPHSGKDYNLGIGPSISVICRPSNARKVYTGTAI